MVAATHTFGKHEIGIDKFWKRLALVFKIVVFDLIACVDQFIQIIGHASFFVRLHIVIS